ncbi:MAG: SpoIIE family protein phosphatase [Ruminococcus sp.]|nr:SpoIIE family protein phosphatase [Ruminococcus sp.]
MNMNRQTMKIKSGRALSIRASCLVFGAAFAAGFGRIIGFPSAVNVALAAVFREQALSAFAGSALSYFLTGKLTDGIIQLSSILVIAAVRLFYPREEQREPVFDAALSTGAMMLFGCVMSVASPSDTYTTALRMINALMCGCIVFAAATVRDRSIRTGVFDISGMNGVLISIIYIVVISTLTALPAGTVNIGRAAGTVCLLMAVRRYRNIGGAVMGSLTACGVILSTPSLAQNTLLLASSGLICGAFIRFGPLLTALVFLISSLVSLVAVGVNGDTFTMFTDLVIGALIFTAIPASAVKRLARRIVGIENAANIAGQSTSAKLSVASKTLSSIRTQLTLVTAAIDRRSKEDTLCSRVKSAVCTDCDLYELCHERKSSVPDAFRKLENTASTYNSVSMLDVGAQLPSCVRKAYLHRSFNDIHSDMLSERAELIKVREMRSLLSQQLSSMESMLADLSFRVGSVRSIDSALSAAVRDHFSSLGYPNVKACVYVDSCFVRCVDVYLTASFKGELVKLTTALSTIAECDLALPTVTEFDGVTRMNFCEEPDLTLETKTYTASSGEEYSGDTFELFSDSPYRRYIVLSDGMGTGKRARLDSMFSVSLVTRLIGAGMSMETSHSLINSLLRVKGWEESFATLDIVKIDLSAATARFLKAGAARSLLCRDGSVQPVGGQAFPPGILADCPPDVEELKLFEGDIILVFSDGISENAATEVTSGLLQEGATLTDIVRTVGNSACAASSDNRHDDVTVIGVKLTKR